MQRVFVLSSVQTPLMPCHPARARELLRKSKARVFRSVPFTIILNSREHGNLYPLELKVAPGSKKTGLALLGFPKSKPSQTRGSVRGFRTGDFVSAVVPTGKKAGHYRGRVAVRASGSFNIKTDSALVQGINSKYCQKIMGCDGYGYSQGNSVGQTRAFLSGLKAGVSCLEAR